MPEWSWNVVPQKRRKTALILSFLCPASLIEQINAAVAVQNERTLKAPLSRSAWIIRAIQRDLDHTRRSRKDRGDALGVALGLAVDSVNDTMIECRDGSCPAPQPTAWAESYEPAKADKVA